MCKKIIGATSTEGKEAAQIQLCAKKYQEDWIYTTLKNLENPSNSIPPSIKNSCCVDIALVPKLNGAQLCYCRSTEPKTESNINNSILCAVAPTVAFMSRSQMKFKWRSSARNKKTCKQASHTIQAAPPHKPQTHKSWLCRASFKTNTLSCSSPVIFFKSLVPIPPCIPSVLLAFHFQSRMRLRRNMAACSDSDSCQLFMIWQPCFPRANYDSTKILLKSPPGKIPFPDRAGANQEISHPKNDIENTWKYRHYRETTDITWFQHISTDTPEIAGGFANWTSLEIVSWAPPCLAEQSHDLSAPGVEASSSDDRNLFSIEVDRNLKRKEKQTKVKHWTCETMPDQYRSYSNVLPFRCAFGLGFTFLILLILFDPFCLLFSNRFERLFWLARDSHGWGARTSLERTKVPEPTSQRSRAQATTSSSQRHHSTANKQKNWNMVQHIKTY